MARGSEAYDFSLFETHTGNAVRVEAPQRAPRPERERFVVQFPKEAEMPKPKRRRHPIRALVSAVCFTAFISICVAMVYSQLQLAELTDQLNTAAQTLEEAESMEVQLNMEAARKMGGAQVEEYAQQELGMSKVMNAQVTYLNVARQDGGTVVRDVESATGLDWVLMKLESLFS